MSENWLFMTLDELIDSVDYEEERRTGNERTD